ncbi:unnamed protein product, partial [Heterosigma akashiwo]
MHMHKKKIRRQQSKEIKQDTDDKKGRIEGVKIDFEKDYRDQLIKLGKHHKDMYEEKERKLLETLDPIIQEAEEASRSKKGKPKEDWWEADRKACEKGRRSP